MIQFLPLLTTLLDKVLPDPAAAADAKLKMLQLAQTGDLADLDASVKLALGQMEVNKAEAQADLFRGGWRPAVGWVCVLGLFYQFLLQPLLPWLVSACGGHVPALPSIDSGALMVLLTGMLGLGGMRTVERLNGKA